MRKVSEWHLPCIAQVAFHLGINLEWMSWNPHILITISVIKPWKFHCVREPWGENLQSSLDLSGELCISSSFISFPSSFQVSGRTCHGSIHASNSCGTLLGRGSLAYESSQDVGDIPHQYPVIKDFNMNVLAGCSRVCHCKF